MLRWWPLDLLYSVYACKSQNTTHSWIFLKNYRRYIIMNLNFGIVRLPLILKMCNNKVFYSIKIFYKQKRSKATDILATKFIDSLEAESLDILHLVLM